MRSAVGSMLARSLARVADGGWLGAALAEQLEG